MTVTVRLWVSVLGDSSSVPDHMTLRRVFLQVRARCYDHA